VPSPTKKWRVWWTEPYPEVWKEYSEKLERSDCEVMIGRVTAEAEKPFSEHEILNLGRDVDALQMEP
jgi:hypothetical protein